MKTKHLGFLGLFGPLGVLENPLRNADYFGHFGRFLLFAADARPKAAS